MGWVCQPLHSFVIETRGRRRLGTGLVLGSCVTGSPLDSPCVRANSLLTGVFEWSEFA